MEHGFVDDDLVAVESTEDCFVLQLEDFARLIHGPYHARMNKKLVFCMRTFVSSRLDIYALSRTYEQKMVVLYAHVCVRPVGYLRPITHV